MQNPKVFRIGTVRYNWPMSTHVSQAFSIAHCTNSVDLPITITWNLGCHIHSGTYLTLTLTLTITLTLLTLTVTVTLTLTLLTLPILLTLILDTVVNMTT